MPSKSAGISPASGPAFVNRLQNFLGPPHRVCDCAYGRRNSLPAIKLRELAGSENARRNQQHAFAALVHSLRHFLRRVKLLTLQRPTVGQSRSQRVLCCEVSVGASCAGFKCLSASGPSSLLGTQLNDLIASFTARMPTNPFMGCWLFVTHGVLRALL